MCEITSTILENVQLLVKLLVCVGVLALFDCILGGIDAMFNKTWDGKKFVQGLIKGLVMGLTVAVVYTVAELFPCILNELSGVITIDAEVMSSVISTAELVAFVFLMYKKYMEGILEKLLVFTGIKKEEVDEVINGHERPDVPVEVDHELDEG